MAAILSSLAVRTALATVSVAVATVAGATTAAAAPLPLERPGAEAVRAAPAPVSTTTGSFDSGADFVGSVALAITDILKDPTWLLLPVVLGACMLTASSGGAVCQDPGL